MFRFFSCLSSRYENHQSDLHQWDPNEHEMYWPSAIGYLIIYKIMTSEKNITTRLQGLIAWEYRVHLLIFCRCLGEEKNECLARHPASKGRLHSRESFLAVWEVTSEGANLIFFFKLMRAMSMSYLEFTCTHSWQLGRPRESRCTRWNLSSHGLKKLDMTEGLLYCILTANRYTCWLAGRASGGR